MNLHSHRHFCVHTELWRKNRPVFFQLFDARFRVFPENFKFVVIKKEMYNLICLALIELIIADQFNVIKVSLCLFDDGHFKSPISGKLVAKKHRVIAKVRTFQMNTSLIISVGIHITHFV